MRELAPPLPDAADDETLIESLHAMVGHPDFPCLGARSVFRRDRATVRVYQELGDASTARALLTDLTGSPRTSISTPTSRPSSPCSAARTSEDERALRASCCGRSCAQVHARTPQPWAPECLVGPRGPALRVQRRRVPPTSSSGCTRGPPGSPAEPRCRRWCSTCTRSSSSCAAEGTFPRMRDRIRARDEALQGRVNPMVSDHGDSLRGPPVLRPGGRVGLARALHATPTRPQSAAGPIVGRPADEPPRTADRHRVPSSRPVSTC